MAKPILVVRVDYSAIDYTLKIIENIKKATDNEYHILITMDPDHPVVQCYNDCKGLPDVDIENLINQFLCKTPV